MIPFFERGFVRTAIALGLLCALQGCYYMQAAKGQLEVFRKRDSIAEVIESPETAPDLVARLRLVEEARQFSVDALGLPDNESYRSYADLNRDYVVWNVFASPEFSLQAKTWCFPVAGCVAYRGYFAEEAARREAAKLKKKGYDVIVGGIPAYSTLGRFNDPVLNTMMRWDDTELVAMIFHELAHQVLYIKGDTTFNESFASAVEEFGIQRWLESRGLEHEFETYDERRDFRQQLTQLLLAARADLQAIFASTVSDDDKRQQKAVRLDALSQEVTNVFARSGRDASAWLKNGMNNARLASVALYDDSLPAFRELMRQCYDDFGCFYEASRQLSKLALDERGKRLETLTESSPLVAMQQT